MQHAPDIFNNSWIASFNKTILLRHVGSREFMYNPFFFCVILKLMILEFTSLIYFDPLYTNMQLLLH